MAEQPSNRGKISWSANDILNPDSLSGRLLYCTIGFVMLAEVLIYVPSIANFRKDWLNEKLSTAQVASLAVEASETFQVAQALEDELLGNVGVFQVVMHRDQSRLLMLAAEDLPMVDATYDLEHTNPLGLIGDAFTTLFAGGSRVIRVMCKPDMGAGELIEIILPEKELHAAMLGYSRNILALSIMISVVTAALVFISLKTILVKPIQRITENMTSFREQPEDADRIITPSSGVIEVHKAETELAAMQSEIRNSLTQKARLAALGTAVSKINHDLRNILTSAQLVSDSLATSDDPKVKKLAPRLVDSIGKAVDLATQTLKYGKAEERPPQKTDISLTRLVDDVGSHVVLPADGRISWVNGCNGEFTVQADPDHLFRILMNIGRNAGQAIEALDDDRDDHEIRITAETINDSKAARVAIDISDTGPGIPEKARQNLFQAFTGSARKGGTGLGLAIAHELAVANGGDIALYDSGANGTTFRVTLPSVHSAEKV